MLQLIKEELVAQGATEGNFITFNFEDMSNAHLLDANALHHEVEELITTIDGKVYLFFDEI